MRSGVPRTGAERRFKRHLRVRNKISGTAERPRLVVFRSLKHIYAQLVDDTASRTIATVSDLGIAPFDIVGGHPILDLRVRRIVINNRGQIAGSAGDHALVWQNGTAHPLGSLGGGHTHVVDLNEDGMVVGMSTTPNGEQHIFIWTVDRGMVDLGTGPQGLSGAWATGINARGDVIGVSAPCIRAPSTADECGPPGQSRATLWRVQR